MEAWVPHPNVLCQRQRLLNQSFVTLKKKILKIMKYEARSWKPPELITSKSSNVRKLRLKVLSCCRRRMRVKRKQKGRIKQPEYLLQLHDSRELGEDVSTRFYLLPFRTTEVPLFSQGEVARDLLHLFLEWVTLGKTIPNIPIFKPAMTRLWSKQSNTQSAEHIAY